MKIKTSELKDRPLDWATKKTLGDIGIIVVRDGEWLDHDRHRYSTDWAQGGPIIEREGITTARYIVAVSDFKNGIKWRANLAQRPGEAHHCGPTPLIAAMRCFVASRLGDEVDVPEGLL